MSGAVDVEAYFARIGYAGPRDPNLATLRAIQGLHVDAIPFENLAAFLGQPVPLDPAALQAKLLTPGRGGWCFEHNLLLSHVLLALGYPVRRLAARVRWNVPPEVMTARSHMLLRVETPEGVHIADAGFGGLTLSAPLRLEADIEQATLHEPHRLASRGDGFALEARIAGEWSTMYVFEMHEQQVADYEVSNWYLANHPESQFVKGLIAARAAPGRRHALRNMRYTIHHGDGRMERRVLGSPEEFRVVLREDFRIAVPEGGSFDDRVAGVIARDSA